MVVLVTVDLASEVPVYRQIADGIRNLLVESALKPGDPLPSVRQLGLDLGVHFNTVAQAYRVLADEGWIELQRRRGAHVVERARPRPPGLKRRDTAFRRLRDITAQLQAEGIPVDEVAAELRALADSLNGGTRAAL